MHKISIGFSTAKHKNPLSSVIQWASNTNFSHVYIKIYSDSLQRFTVYHASKHSLHFLSYERFLDNAEIIEEIDFYITGEQKKQVLNYCMDMAGVSYGWLTLIGIAYKVLVNRFGFTINNPFQDHSKSGICSEVGYQILKRIGCNDVLNPENVTLKPVYNLVKKFHSEQNYE